MEIVELKIEYLKKITRDTQQQFGDLIERESVSLDVEIIQFEEKNETK